MEPAGGEDKKEDRKAPKKDAPLYTIVKEGDQKSLSHLAIGQAFMFEGLEKRKQILRKRRLESGEDALDEEEEEELLRRMQAEADEEMFQEEIRAQEEYERRKQEAQNAEQREREELRKQAAEFGLSEEEYRLQMQAIAESQKAHVPHLAPPAHHHARPVSPRSFSPSPSVAAPHVASPPHAAAADHEDDVSRQAAELGMTEGEYRAQMKAIQKLEADEERKKKAKEAAEFGLSLEEYEQQLKAMHRYD
eukprot:TRINITY_DN1697_c1_g3_i1.p1 TRINITY_DN1697_c1_g3~~TRINITY_DN1697_c1_g3_i1.p1  ORF type:complete len:249 (-),score=116.77 TRINITY_DN1697_c1_g3_i1:87-833(-)